MQKELSDEYWEGKRLQEARESAMKNTIGLLDVAERLGLLKGKYLNLENFLEAYSGAVNQMVDTILKNINLKSEIKTAKEITTTHVTNEEDEEICSECGKSFTEGELRWKAAHPDDPQLCYKCKKAKGMI